MNTKNPLELIKLAKKGDKNAFEAIYELYFTPVFRYFYMRLKNKEEAEDLSQKLFLKIFENLENLNFKAKNPITYFMQAAKNLLIDYWRTNKELILDDQEKFFNKIESKEIDLNAKLDQKQKFNLILEKIEELSDKQKEIITLKFVCDLNNPEIADLTGQKESAIRKNQERALKKLKILLKI